ncbi:MAG TPA: response regulator transcription factor [Steroidobacteraceae bacterium]
MHRVILVDDHPIVRHGLRHVLEKEKDFIVVGEADSADEGHAVIDHFNPDTVITDLQLREGDGIEFVRRVHTRRPGLPILVFSMHDEAIYAERLIAVGAAGFIMKHASIAEFVSALRCVMGGGTYVSKPVGQRIIQRIKGRKAGTAHPFGILSHREVQILRLIGAGVSTRAIAQSLHLSIKTIESHRQRVKQKLHIITAAQLMQCAISWNLQWACADEGPQVLLAESCTVQPESGACSTGAPE